MLRVQRGANQAAMGATLKTAKWTLLLKKERRRKTCSNARPTFSGI
jgi:hypothetical protein